MRLCKVCGRGGDVQKDLLCRGCFQLISHLARIKQNNPAAYRALLDSLIQVENTKGGTR